MNDYLEKQITTQDGHILTGRIFQDKNTEQKGTVLMVPAMGVSQRYYASFASWLAAQGYRTITFDYRGIGLSHSGTLRGFQATIIDWAKLDCSAMVETALADYPELPLYWVGHSLGGQILPFVPNQDRIAKMVTVATGSGYWRENSLPLKRVAWWLWYVVAPLSVPLFGYFPGKKLRKVGNLPSGVMVQWRKWCLNPDYAVGAEGESVRQLYASVKTPIVSLSFTDDEFMSARNIESIHSFYTNAKCTMKHIVPQDIGVQRIGHFGFFRPSFQESLWKFHLLPELS